MVTTERQYVTAPDGTRQAVIIPLEEYKRLLEDLHDLAVVAERRTEERLPLDQVLKRLEQDGALCGRTDRVRGEGPSRTGQDNVAAGDCGDSDLRAQPVSGGSDQANRC